MGATTLSSRAIIGAYYKALQQDAGLDLINAISMLFQSDQESESYRWLGQVPTMREWVGGRQAKGLRESGVTITNKPFESTLYVTRDEIRRDKTGQVMTRVRDLAKRTNTHFYSLLSQLLANGNAATCYDGQYFFDTDHSEGDSGDQSNDISVDISGLPVSNHGSPSAPSAAEMEQAILSSVQQIMSFKDDQGEPINEAGRDFLVIVPINLWKPALAAATSPIIDGGDTNLLASQNGFRLNVRANARLTDDDVFYTVATDGGIKPFIRQEEVPVQMSAIAEGSELEFDKNQHKYGVYASRNVGYGMWQMANRTKLT